MLNKYLKFHDKDKLFGQDELLKKTRKLFPGEESLLKFQARSPLKRGAMPASPSNGFFK